MEKSSTITSQVGIPLSLYWVYRGFAPTDESPIGMWEIEIKIDETGLTGRVATGLKIEENLTALFDCKESIEFEIFPHFRYKYAPNVIHCHEHWFLLAVEQEFKPILSEHLAYQWVSPEHAIQMTKSPNNAEAIKKYLISK